jgi:hypothetical protein
MYPQRYSFHRQAHVGKVDSRITLLLALITFLLVASGAFAANPYQAEVQMPSNPPPGLTLSVNPPITVPAGGSVTVTLTIGGATGNVTVSASGVSSPPSRAGAQHFVRSTDIDGRHGD